MAGEKSKKTSSIKILKIYIQIHKGKSEKTKDTIQHTAFSKEEAVEFITKHTT